jgi:hypothetical protein
MKIPIIESQQGSQPAYVNEGAATAEARAIEGFGKGLMVAGEQVSQYNENLTRIKVYQQKMDELAAANEGASKLIDIKKSLIEKRAELESIQNYKDYEQEADKFFSDTASNIIKETKNPLVKSYLGKHLETESLAWKSHTLAKVDKLFIDGIKALDVTRLNTAIELGDEDMFNIAMTGLRGNIEGGVYDADTGAKNIVNYEKAFKAKQEVKAFDVQESRLTSGDAIGLNFDLTTGKLDKEIPDQGKRNNLLSRSATIIKAEEAARHKAIEDAAKADSEKTYAGLNERIRKGENVIQEVYALGPNGSRTLLKSHYDELLSHSDAIAKAGITSDPKTLRDVIIATTADVPEISTEQVIEFMKTNKLSTKDGEEALNRIRTSNVSLQDKTKTKQNQDYTDARTAIHDGLGISGLILQTMEKLDPVQQGLITRANSELWSRSIGRGGTENPMAVAKEILPEYQKALSGQALLSISSLEKIIDIKKYPSSDSVNKAYESGKMDVNEYLRKIRLFQERQRAIDLEGYLKGASSGSGTVGKERTK